MVLNNRQFQLITNERINFLPKNFDKSFNFTITIGERKMKLTKCLDCGELTINNFEYCDLCLERKWNGYSGFIAPKHDPRYLPWALPEFRSVVTIDFIINKSQFIHTIITNGQFFSNRTKNNISCVLNQPIGTISGSAIPEFCPCPTYPLDSIVVVDAIENPHVFAEDYSIIADQINYGQLIPNKLIHI